MRSTLIPKTFLVSAADADLTFESSDGVLFKLHRSNLSTHSHAFPGPHVRTNGETVRLEEDSEVLELLLLHVYPDPAPPLDDEDFRTVTRLADAAEKYQVASAMEICRLHMKCVLDFNELSCTIVTVYTEHLC